METRRPSATAQIAATFRAAHQLLDSPLVFDDPLAVRILGKEGEAALRASLPELAEPRRGGLRAAIAMRNRHAEDELRQLVSRGPGQYVILGAGLDTFAYRNPFPETQLRVFEVDHPATQEGKRARLAEVGIQAPASLTYVALDFARSTLEEGLRGAGFQMAVPTFVAWLGVSMYLEPAAVMETLRFFGRSMAKGSAVVFDFLPLPSSLDVRTRSVVEGLAERARSLGEPWLGYFDPAQLVHDLGGLGFTSAETLNAAQGNARYFRDRTDGLCLTGATHIMTAHV